MKNRKLSLTIFAVVTQYLLLTNVSQANPDIELKGQWKLISSELTIGENAISLFDPKTHKMIKLFTHNHFAFVSKGPHRKKFASASPSEREKIMAFENFGGGGGSYSIAGNKYTENVEYCHFPNYEGMRFEFRLTMEGNKLIQQGNYPLKALGFGEQDGFLKEVYERVE